MPPNQVERFALEARERLSKEPLAGRIDHDWSPGLRVLLREGCDRTVATCAARFGNAVNFQGEPFLPGNDMLAQYPVAR